MKHTRTLNVVGSAQQDSPTRVRTMESRNSLANRKALPLKRVLDLVLTCLILVGLSPFLLLIVLAIKIGSSGPVLHTQIRLGKKGRPFVFYKFRSMSVDGDDAEHRSYVKRLIKAGNPYEGGKNGKLFFKISDDGRVTRVGKLIRKYSVDEFPQLFNVLRGEMSLVGPRPPLPYEYEDYSDWDRRRLDGIPGITGLWQVSGKNTIPFEEMVKLDIHYLKDWSLWLDIKIIFRTIHAMLKGEDC